MDEHKISDEVSELLYEGIAKLDYQELQYDIEKDQPQHASWIILDALFTTFGTDVYTIIEYSDARAMQAELLKLIKAVFTPELLEHIRNGNIKNFTLRIGPETLSGLDLNEENDIEVDDGENK